ncbi:MAG: hypothetical protein HWE23_14840 [Rhodobacteraceae bacterium]|nr:hypothetical protein [Paracoccaceae bacterium]
MLTVVKFMLRVLGSFAFAGAVLALISDGSQTIVRNALSVKSTASFWLEVAPRSLDDFHGFLVTNFSTGHIGEVVYQIITQSPLWASLTVVGFILLWAGWPERRQESILAF